MVTSTEMVEEIAVQHNPDKGGTDEYMEAVEASGDIKRATVHPIG